MVTFIILSVTTKPNKCSLFSALREPSASSPSSRTTPQQPTINVDQNKDDKMLIIIIKNVNNNNKKC